MDREDALTASRNWMRWQTLDSYHVHTLCVCRVWRMTRNRVNYSVEHAGWRLDRLYHNFHLIPASFGNWYFGQSVGYVSVGVLSCKACRNLTLCFLLLHSLHGPLGIRVLGSQLCPGPRVLHTECLVLAPNSQRTVANFPMESWIQIYQIACTEMNCERIMYFEIIL